MKNCRPNSWWVRLIDKWFSIRVTCDQRCLTGNYDAPCQFPKLSKGCNGDCNQGRLECNCDIKETK